MKKFQEKIIILEGEISNYIPSCIQEFKPGHNKGFDLFSDETILYALLEYSKFPRPCNKLERINYIYEKCVEWSNKGLLPGEYTVELECDYDEEKWFIKSKKTELPF